MMNRRAVHLHRVQVALVERGDQVYGRPWATRWERKGLSLQFGRVVLSSWHSSSTGHEMQAEAHPPAVGDLPMDNLADPAANANGAFCSRSMLSKKGRSR